MPGRPAQSVACYTRPASPESAYWHPDAQASSCAIITMVGVGDTGVADTLEARLEDTRRRHLEGKYGQILPLAVIEVGIRIVWAEEHPPRPASPRPVNSEGGIDVVINASDQVGSSAGGTSRQRGVIHADEVGCIQAQELQLSAAILSSQGDVGGRRISVMPSSAIHVKAGGIAPSYGYFKFTPDTVSITPLLVGRPDILTWKEAIEPQLKVAGLKCFDTVATTPESNSELRAEFRIALKSCRDYLDAGHQAWHSIESTYQITNDLYIGQLEEQLMHLRMGEQETATDYCNQAWRLLATMWMTGVQYLTTSYDTHVLKGLPSSYNLIKRLSVVPGTRATLNEDSLTSYILNDEVMQEAERSSSRSDGSGGERPAKDADKHKAARESGQGGGSRRRECRLCHIHDHLSFECPDRSDFDDGDSKGGRERSAVGRPHWGSNLGMEKQSTKSLTSAKNIDSSPGGKERGDKQASCSLVGVVEPTVSLAPEAGKDFQAVAAAMQANLAVILLNSGCSHHLMGTKEAFVDLEPSGDVKHVHGFNRSPQDVRGHSTVALQGESGKQPKENGVKLQEDGDEMLLVSASGEVVGWASYTGRILCTDLRPCLAKLTTPTMEVVALRAIVSPTKSTPARWHARLAHISVDTITSSAKHEVATVLDIKSSAGTDSPCVSWVGGKLLRHTFSDKGSDAEDALATCTSTYAGREFHMKQFTDFVDGKGIVHNLTCPYTPQQNGTAEREMRTVVELVRTMLLHMGEQHHWWHLALRQAIWVRNCLERSTLLLGTTPYQLLTKKKPKLSLARVWGCMAQFLVSEQQCRGKLKPKVKWGLHFSVSEESKGWELLEFTDNRVVTTSDVVFYETMSLEVWKSEHRPSSGRTQVNPPTDTSTAMLPLLAKVGELADEDAEVVRPPSPSPAPPAPPLVADLRKLTSTLASGDEGRSGALPVAPAKSIAGGQLELVKGTQAGRPTTGEQPAVQPTMKQSVPGQSAGEPITGEKSAGTPTVVQQDAEGSDAGGNRVEQLDAEESTDSDVVEVQLGPRHTCRIRKPPDFLSYHACLPPAACTAVYNEVDDDLLYDDVKEDVDLPELDPNMHADPEHRWDITKTTMEALASWKGKVVKAAMDEEIRSLVGMGTWKLVKRPCGVHIMKNRWVLMTKYHIGDTVAREKAMLVVKGFTQVYGADYDKTYVPVSSYATLRIFLSIVAVLDLNLMQLDTKNAFLRSKLDREMFLCTSRTTTTMGPARLTAVSPTSPTLLTSLELIDYVDTDDLGDKHNQTSTGDYKFVYGGATVSWSSQRIKCAMLSSTESEYVAAIEAGKEGRCLRFLLAEFRQLDAGTPTVL
ncbi:unnamed protein product [Closterium sp. NIES-54]